jgi:uncharacterized membrane protein YoaK (UPF0700 family)
MKRVPSLIILVLAITIWVNFFTGAAGGITDSIKIGSATLWAFANLLSSLYFFIRAYPQITQKKIQYWWLRAWAVIVALIYIVVGLVYSQSGDQYVWLTNIIVVAADRVSWLPMMFVVLTIIRRSFVARNLSTALYVIGAGLAYARATPMLTANPMFLEFVQWFAKYVTRGLGRTLTIGAGTAALLLIVRQFMGLERYKEVQ